MSKYTVLYNPHSGAGTGFKIAKELETLIENSDFTYIDITTIADFDAFLTSLSPDIDIILTGGDGTLNSFVNKISNTEISHKIYFYASGTGNDFARDIKFKKRTKPICINKYIKNLPTAIINGKEYRFMNCIGSGMDGYCCQEVERLRAISKKRANYALVAIKALLYAYKPCTAEVNIDGKTYLFKDTWLVPTMNGKYFGGGFMAAPNQDRLNKEHTLSIVAMRSKNVLKIALAFLLIFIGKHTKLKSVITILEGHNISVKLSKSATLQIDGETIENITEYSISSVKEKINI